MSISIKHVCCMEYDCDICGHVHRKYDPQGDACNLNKLPTSMQRCPLCKRMMCARSDNCTVEIGITMAYGQSDSAYPYRILSQIPVIIAGYRISYLAIVVGLVYF